MYRFLDKVGFLAFFLKAGFKISEFVTHDHWFLISTYNIDIIGKNESFVQGNFSLTKLFQSHWHLSITQNWRRPPVLEDAVSDGGGNSWSGSGGEQGWRPKPRPAAARAGVWARWLAGVTGPECGKLLLTCRHSEPEPATVSLSLSESQSSARVQGARSAVTLLSVWGLTIIAIPL